MPRPRVFSIEEVLNFTVKDIQGPNFVEVVEVKGWHKLTPDQRERCIIKLRDLKRQRDDIAQSTAVDAKELEDRLNRVYRPRSPTPILPPYNPNAPEFLEENLKREREAYEDLVGNNGRPCYPIELGFEVFNNPGQYEDNFSYWRGELGVHHRSSLIFSAQLRRWKRFRQFQQRNRRYFISHSRFPEFQQKVLERRQRHGLDGDAQLLEEQDKQSKLDDWMEYQDYELREYERLEKDLQETQERVASRRKVLTAAGISAFEGIQELEFATYYGLAMEWDGEEVKGEKKEKLAERKLRLAQKRLKAAESDNPGEWVERAFWVRLFRKEVESAQIRLDEAQRLAEDAKRELDPYSARVLAKLNEFAKRREEDVEEAESTEFQDQIKKRNGLLRRATEASNTRDRAKEEMEFAEEGHKAARSDNFGETVERAALIKVIQGEVRSAETQFEEAKEEAEMIRLKRKVISGLSSISVIKGKMERHKVLLIWIEQQRREISDGRNGTRKEGGQGRLKRAGSRAVRNHLATDASNSNKLLKANGRLRKQSTARSVLSPIDPARVSKAPSRTRRPQQKTSPCDASQAVERAASEFNTPEPRSKRAFKVKDAMPASLGPIHSSRVSKPGGKQATRRGGDGTKLPPTTGAHRPIREDHLGTSSTRSAGRKTIQHLAKASPRRSTRLSKQPERFRPAYP